MPLITSETSKIRGWIIRNAVWFPAFLPKISLESFNVAGIYWRRWEEWTEVWKCQLNWSSSGQGKLVQKKYVSWVLAFLEEVLQPIATKLFFFRERLRLFPWQNTWHCFRKVPNPIDLVSRRRRRRRRRRQLHQLQVEIIRMIMTPRLSLQLFLSPGTNF